MSLRNSFEQNALTIFMADEETSQEEAALRRQRMLIANATDALEMMNFFSVYREVELVLDHRWKIFRLSAAK